MNNRKQNESKRYAGRLKIAMISLLILAVMAFNSCKKFVTIDPPATILTEGAVFEDVGTATGAQLAIYKGMFDNAESMYAGLRFGFLSDELQNYSNDAALRSLYVNAVTPSNALGWGHPYNYIYQANAVIEGLGSSKSVDAPVKNQLTGEALFVRAFWHFYLTGWYGDIPLVTSTDYKINSNAARAPQMNVYRQIISDLQDAKRLLNSNYVDQSDTAAITTERVRPNIAAAEALLARTYMFAGEYDSAEAEATQVINNPLYVLEPDLNNVFLVGSQEAIWQLETPQPNNTNTRDGDLFILIAAPSTTTDHPATISTQLMSSFEPGDNRQTNWLGTYTNNAVTPALNYYFPYKYKVYKSPNISEYTMVLRLAEQYLIRAEARVQQGNWSGALSDLNVIRHRAGLGDYAGATDKVSLLAAILHERQVELFAEWGHRWLDLVRTKNANAVMSIVCPQKGGTWDTDGHQQLLPIPQSEILKDVNLTQNPGYF